MYFEPLTSGKCLGARPNAHMRKPNPVSYSTDPRGHVGVRIPPWFQILAKIFCATYEDRTFTASQAHQFALKMVPETAVECEVLDGKCMPADEARWRRLGTEVSSEWDANPTVVAGEWSEWTAKVAMGQ